MSAANHQNVCNKSPECPQQLLIIRISATNYQNGCNKSSECLQQIIRMSTTNYQNVCNKSSECQQQIIRNSTTNHQKFHNKSPECPQLIIRMSTTNHLNVRISDSFDPYQALHYNSPGIDRPDLGPNCLQGNYQQAKLLLAGTGNEFNSFLAGGEMCTF